MTDLISLTKKLVSIPSTVGDEKNIIKFITRYLKFCKLDVDWFDKKSANIIAHTAIGEEKCVILNAHLDTVFPVEKWHINPYKPFLKNGNLYGLGAADMKAGVAIFLDVFKKIYSSNYRFNLILLLTSNEEGMSKGSYRAVNTIKEKKYKPLISLITEPTQECIMLGARGRYTIEISVCGISAHGAVPELGVNAISDAAEIVRSLENLKLKYDRVLGYGSTCVLKIDGGTTTLSVPELCKIYVDRHFVRNESEKYILADFKKIINKLKLKSDVKVRIMPRETPYLKPYLTQSNDRYVKLFCTEYKNFYQTKPKFMYARSVGDFNRFGEIMPTIVFGPIGMNWHAADEYVNISSVIRCRDFYLNYLKHLDAKIRKGFL